MEILKDNFYLSGRDFDGFKTAIENMTKNTKIKRIPMENFRFLSSENNGDGTHAGYYLNPEYVFDKTFDKIMIKRYDIKSEKPEYSEEVMDEAMKNGLFVKFDNSDSNIQETVENLDFIPVSGLAYTSLFDRARCSGEGLNNIIGDIAIAKNFNSPAEVTVISRIDDVSGAEKVFAVMSDKYAYISQEILLDIIKNIEKEASEDLGRADVVSWNVSNSLTSIYIEFPDYAKEISEVYKIPDTMVPGILIETSDIGISSLSIRGYFSRGTSKTLVGSSFEQMHSGAIDDSKIIEEVRNRVFPEFTKYPEKLASLMMINLTDDSMDENKKRSIMNSIYKDTFKYVGLGKLIGTKRKNSIIKQLTEAINGEINYTAYDVVMTFMTLSDSLTPISNSLKRSISGIAGKIFDYNFEDDDILVI